jgi:hypothetical protein
VPKGQLWRDPKTGKRPVAWHLEASLLYDRYRCNINPSAGAWREGPTLRFIQLALERVGLGYHETRTIEQALKRS